MLLGRESLLHLERGQLALAFSVARRDAETDEAIFSDPIHWTAEQVVAIFHGAECIQGRNIDAPLSLVALTPTNVFAVSYGCISRVQHLFPVYF